MVRRDNRRDEVVAAALEVFAERGFRGASLAVVAERVGISQQGLLHYFPNKELLLAAVLELREERDVDLFRDGEEIRVDLERITRLVEHNALRRGLIQSFTVLSAESVTDGHPAQEYFRDRYDRARRALADGLRDTPLPAGLTAEHAAALLIAVLDGLQLQWLLSPEAIDMPEVFRAFAALLRP